MNILMCFDTRKPFFETLPVNRPLTEGALAEAVLMSRSDAGRVPEKTILVFHGGAAHLGRGHRKGN